MGQAEVEDATREAAISRAYQPFMRCGPWQRMGEGRRRRFSEWAPAQLRYAALSSAPPGRYPAGVVGGLGERTLKDGLPKRSA